MVQRARIINKSKVTKRNMHGILEKWLVQQDQESSKLTRMASQENEKERS